MICQARSLFLAAACALLAGCATTSSEFLEQQPGFAVLKGRVMRVERVAADDFRRLADGVAIVVKEGAAVTLEFPDGNKRTLDLKAGAMVLWGLDSDYVLRPEQD